LGKGAIRPADTTLGVNHYRKKAADNLKRLVTEFPQFRAIGSVYHLLARLYEKPPLSIQDIDNKMPAKVSLGAVCSNWQYQPFQNDFKEFLKNKGQGLLTAESDKNYINWMIYDFPTNLAFDLFKNCQAVNGSVQFIGTAWATLGKFLSKKTIEFKPVNPDATEEEQIKVKLFNLAMTKWAALSAYNRALSSDFKELSTRGYVVYFAGLMLYQNEINPALAMKLFDQVIDMGQNQDENSPHEAAIKYIGFLMQEEKIDSSKYNWTKPYPVKCDGKCPLKKLRVYYKDKMHKPHVKRIWLGVADFFRGLEDNKIYQRSEQDLIHAYNIYSYIFRKMDVEGGWKYNPRKADIFWKMREIITEQMQNYRSLLKEVKSRRDIKEIRNKISFWSNKKNALSQYALNTVFAPGEIQKFLTSHQKFLSRNAIKKMKLRTVSLDKLRKDIVNIKSYALISSGEILADQAKDLFFQYQKAKGSRKEELRKQAKSAFEKAYKYFLGIMEEYPNSIYEYNSMIRILEFYCELPGSSDDSISKDKKLKEKEPVPYYYFIELATDKKTAKKKIYEGLKWGRKVRDSHLGNQWRKNAAAVINYLYMDKLEYKDPEYPFDPKKEESVQFKFKPQEIPENYRNYITDAKIYMKLFPEDENSPVFLYKIARIYLKYQHLEEARKYYKQILEDYCSNEVAYSASYDIFLTYKHQYYPPEKQTEFKEKRNSVIAELEKKKCGGDEKHRELMDMIAKLELNELVRTSRKSFDEAMEANEKKNNDPEKWKKALAHYEVLVKKILNQKPKNEEEKAERFRNLFGIYWNTYLAKKELGDFKGAIETLETIKRKKDVFAVAENKGYKEIIYYELAEAYTRAFDDKNAILMWRELAKTGPKGTWKIRKDDKVKKTKSSQFKFMAEEKIFWIYKARGKEYKQEMMEQGKKLVDIFDIGKRQYQTKFTIPEKDAYEKLATQINVKKDEVDKYFKVFWNCDSGNCQATVTDKKIYYQEMMFDLELSDAFEGRVSTITLKNALKEVEKMEDIYNRYLPLSKIFTEKTKDGKKIYLTASKYESMWKKRLNLIYQKASIWNRIVEKSRPGSASWTQAKEEYSKYLEQYKKLYEKNFSAQPQLNPGYAVIYYGEALIKFINEEYQTVQDPFPKKQPQAIGLYQDAQLELIELQKKVSGQSETLQKQVKKLNEKLEKAKQQYINEIKEFIDALQKIQAHQNKSKVLSQKDLLKYYNRFKKYNKKYPNFIKDLQKVGFQKALTKLILSQKDIKNYQKQIQKLSGNFSKDYPKQTKKYMDKFLPKMKKALAELKKQYSENPVALIDQLEKTYKKLVKITKTKPQLTFADLQQILQPLGQMAILSIMLPSNNALALTYNVSQSVKNRADSYSWYKEQKGYLRKQVAKIKADLLALKMRLLRYGIKFFKDAPYLEKLSKVEYQENPDAKLKEAGCPKVSKKEDLQCFLDYKRKNYYQRIYTLNEGNKTVEKEIIPLDKLKFEYTKTYEELHKIVKNENVSSKHIIEAYENYHKIISEGKGFGDIYEPKLELVK
jgi:hypothetical protein